MKTKYGLEIGGEKTPAYPDYDQLDNIPDFGANIICDARSPLPIPDDTYQHVFVRNVLEHFSWRSTDRIIREWFRIVKPGGLLEIIVPDTLGIIADYHNGIDSWEHTCKRLAGGQDYPGNTHLAFFTFDEFDKLLPDCMEHAVLEQTHAGGGITARLYK